MGRNSVVRPYFLRHVLRNRRCSSSFVLSSSLNKTLIPSPPIASPTIPTTPFSISNTNILFPRHFFHCRTLCSSSDPSNIVLIKSDEELNSSLNKVQVESLPAIFYFTAVWCGPCRFISPIISELSKKYTHVTIYKVDIDQEGLGSTLSKLNITAVPTLHFFQSGKKESEVIGADIARLKDNMERLYK